MKNKIIAVVVGLMLAPAFAQAPQKELIYAVCREGDVEVAKVSVVQEGLKFTVNEKPLVITFTEIELLKKSIEELNK